jgi:transketolase
MNNLTITQLQKKANDIRIDIIKMLSASNSGHPAGSLDEADIFTALYFDILKHDPKNPDWEERDILVLSNGHCVPARYAAMAHAGYFPREELMTLRKLGSRLQGHPERLKLPGLETTSGPLGCGLSQAAGMARVMQTDGVTGRWIYCVASDGEHDEGNLWEAIMFAAKYNLHNLIVIVDRNNIQIDGTTEEVMPLGDLTEKWAAFGWHTQEIDGHNMQEIIDSCSRARAVTDKPSVIIARTIPGKGVPFMEGKCCWHGATPKPEQEAEAIEALEKLGAEITKGQK